MRDATQLILSVILCCAMIALLTAVMPESDEPTITEQRAAALAQIR